MSTVKKSIKGTKTERLVAESYMAESAAYSRYTFYAQAADKEQYFPIGQVFRETAANELHHAKVFFKMLEGGKVDVGANIDAGVIGDTASNLATAAAEELAEGVDAYMSAAEVADSEGFHDIASHFRAIASVERHHRERFLTWLQHVHDGTVWKRDHAITWECLVCGYQVVANEPPTVCPGCDHPYQHYMALDIE